MNPQSTDRVPADTNNLMANVILSGSVAFLSTDFAATGGTIGDSPARASYYATKSVVLPITSDQIPFIYAFRYHNQLVTSSTYYSAFNYYNDYENPYEQWDRHWYTLTKTTANGRSVLSLNFFIVSSFNGIQYGSTAFYRVVSANATESSGL